MATRRSDNRFLIGLLVGAGIGLATAYLFDSKRGRRNREVLLGSAKKVADRVASLDLGKRTWGDRKIERAGRTLGKRIERIRSAGF